MTVTGTDGARAAMAASARAVTLAAVLPVWAVRTPPSLLLLMGGGEDGREDV
jgi:hypothetical protein